MPDNLAPSRIPPHTNPREHFAHHRERGPRSWRYAIADIAAAVRLEPRTVREHARRGLFNPADLISVCQYIARRRAVISFAGEPRSTP